MKASFWLGGSAVDGFVGRRTELRLLDELLESVSARGRGVRRGRAVLVRGRRRVGKSRLVEEFLDRANLPHVFFTAVGGSREGDLAAFSAEVAASSLPEASRFEDFPVPQTWDAALSLLTTVLPTDTPSIVVIDEMPYLTQEDPTFEGALQKAYDRTLSKLPVLLVLIGSDLAMMEQLNTYGRPFYQRGTEMVVPPLNPAEVASMLDLTPADAFDAYLISGGLPLILEEWPHGAGPMEYLEHALQRPTSALLVSGERTLAAEFPTEVQARTVLGTIGHGERTFSSIRRVSGDLNPGALTRSLETLRARRMVAADLPLSTRPSRETRYRIEDPYLRFWLSFVGPAIPLIERGRGDRAFEIIRTNWTTWRGRAVEPIIRDALSRLTDGLFPENTNAIGGYWTRTNDPEIDIVGADRAPIAKTITAVGSIKWLERKPFDTHDLVRLIQHRSQLPGASDDTPLVAVARSGCTSRDVIHLTPDRLITAWT